MDFPMTGILELIDGATEGMTAAELAAAPAGKWSAAQTLEHLLLTFTGTCRTMERTLAKGRTNSRPTLYQRFAVVLITRLGYFPRGRQAPEMVRPRGMLAGQVLPAIHVALADMDAKITACEQRLGRGKLADHPVLGPLTANQWRRFHLVHTRHHMRQIEARRSASVKVSGEENSARAAG